MSIKESLRITAGEELVKLLESEAVYIESDGDESLQIEYWCNMLKSALEEAGNFVGKRPYICLVCEERFWVPNTYFVSCCHCGQHYINQKSTPPKLYPIVFPGTIAMRVLKQVWTSFQEIQHSPPNAEDIPYILNEPF